MMTNGTVEVIAIHTVECEGEVYRHPAKFFMPEHAVTDMLRLGSVRLVERAPVEKPKRSYTRKKKG